MEGRPVVYWLVADSTSPIEPASYLLEEFPSQWQPQNNPQGPLAFFNDDTIAAAVI